MIPQQGKYNQKKKTAVTSKIKIGILTEYEHFSFVLTAVKKTFYTVSYTSHFIKWNGV